MQCNRNLPPLIFRIRYNLPRSCVVVSLLISFSFSDDYQFCFFYFLSIYTFVMNLALPLSESAALLSLVTLMQATKKEVFESAENSCFSLLFLSFSTLTHTKHTFSLSYLLFCSLPSP